jgi:hypothetical protein
MKTLPFVLALAFAAPLAVQARPATSPGFNASVIAAQQAEAGSGSR